MTNDFQFVLRVRYAECDAQHVVFNARYADYADLAVTEYFRALFGGYKELLARGIDNQVVKMLVEWKSPARFDDVLCISVRLKQMGTTSFTVQFAFYEQTAMRHLADAEIVYVVVDAKTYQKMPIPQAMREQLERGAPGVVVNQSGLALG
jgi:acyl-CoA thioester hydrolase